MKLRRAVHHLPTIGKTIWHDYKKGSPRARIEHPRRAIKSYPTNFKWQSLLIYILNDPSFTIIYPMTPFSRFLPQWLNFIEHFIPIDCIYSGCILNDLISSFVMRSGESVESQTWHFQVFSHYSLSTFCWKPHLNRTSGCKVIAIERFSKQ